MCVETVKILDVQFVHVVLFSVHTQDFIENISSSAFY